jgi:hypothetical protein
VAVLCFPSTRGDLDNEPLHRQYGDGWRSLSSAPAGSLLPFASGYAATAACGCNRWPPRSPRRRLPRPRRRASAASISSPIEPPSEVNLRVYALPADTLVRKDAEAFVDHVAVPAEVAFGRGIHRMPPQPIRDSPVKVPATLEDAGEVRSAGNSSCNTAPRRTAPHGPGDSRDRRCCGRGSGTERCRSRGHEESSPASPSHPSRGSPLGAGHVQLIARREGSEQRRHRSASIRFTRISRYGSSAPEKIEYSRRFTPRPARRRCPGMKSNRSVRIGG